MKRVILAVAIAFGSASATASACDCQKKQQQAQCQCAGGACPGSCGAKADGKKDANGPKSEAPPAKK